MKAREQKRKSQQREYEKQQKKIEQVETHIKELSSWSQKGTRAVYKTRRCERILSCKSEANGCTSEVKTKTT